MIQVGTDLEKCVTFEDGTLLRNLIEAEFARSGRAIVSFAQISAVSSSFVNGAFVQLMSDRDLEWFRSNVRVVEVTTPIADLIRKGVQRGAEKSRNH